jgi:hypothetical protein
MIIKIKKSIIKMNEKQVEQDEKITAALPAATATAAADDDDEGNNYAKQLNDDDDDGDGDDDNDNNEVKKPKLTTTTATTTTITSSTAKDNKNKSNNSKNNNKRKKRKRSKSEDIQELHEVQIERYDRLLFTSHKQIHKQVKLVKTFLLQKEIRSNNCKDKENKVDSLKGLDLNVVTQQAIRQLGLYHCDPRYKMTTTMTTETETTSEAETPVYGDDDDNNNNNNSSANATSAIADRNDNDVAIKKAEDDDKEKNKNKMNRNMKTKKKKINDDKSSNTPTEIPSPLNTNDPQKIYVDSILTHKRFSKVLEEWNTKVTEYRRWCMKLEQRNYSNPYSGEDDIIVSSSKRAKKNKNKNKEKSEREQQKQKQRNSSLQATVENESSLFCTLGGGGDEDNEDGGDEDGETGGTGTGKYSSYGPAGAEDFEPIKLARKNRQGQRQRRAKAQAIQAKKEGRKHIFHNHKGSSLNWREPKVKIDNENERYAGGAAAEKLQRGSSRGRGKELKRNTFNSGGHQEQQQQQQQYDNTKGGDNSQQQQQKTAARSAVADHPSWAAKQAQTTGIVAFKGKKITF